MCSDKYGFRSLAQLHEFCTEWIYVMLQFIQLCCLKFAITKLVHKYSYNLSLKFAKGWCWQLLALNANAFSRSIVREACMTIMFLVGSGEVPPLTFVDDIDGDANGSANALTRDEEKAKENQRKADDEKAKGLLPLGMAEELVEQGMLDIAALASALRNPLQCYLFPATT
ncbi:hypothetical protein ZIOFF_051937 [Zingiber officinale]|uniref:Uncharacterized protein n=1 Tax=Zingiber officinale TaxID=94328 RepID=A0A8J5FNG2_ZINOF|nr:hypothetical protein ZIOFF_051937 [Zingiber officinale]